jgi:pimeloyl-ACP methyl ester carboxylesterase
MPAETDGRLFLPDFVGYPICFFGLRALLPATLPTTYVDYTGYWPYESIPELARAICADLPRHGIGLVIGYSFGAYVAIEVAALLAAEGMEPRLLLIDPPVLADAAALAARDVDQVLRSHPDYAYLFDLIDCDLARLDCMIGNIAALGRVGSPVALPVPCTMLLAGERAAPAEFGGNDDLELHSLPDCDHRSILSQLATIGHIVNGLATGRGPE